MTSSLIHFDDKHVSAGQSIMANDRVLEGFIHNLLKSAPSEIHGYFQDVEFLHASRMLGGYKLDPTLISGLVKRWRPQTYTFHLPCGECTITLEDVALQLGFTVDGSVVRGSVVFPDKQDLCKTILEKVPNKFQGCRIEMRWFTYKVATTPSRLQRMWSTKLGINRFGRLYRELFRATKLDKMSINGCLLVKPWPSYVGLPEQFEDIPLLLDQCSEADVSY
ncbi:serine/threonine-protein phosphatase 7 long form-like protein isoform X1 [Gossypium australe]|uniref:Serine/threonine-protein phosphatase 7 long form-like protein isoform X1 n=1 Tax=Gossypium australe TaxID=47621 RepID=A0A5B6VM22_9ROSI|nr:serine/threonine-protein phosphatase 7 long form-like protein isoform X1 [Gossypium australe]